MGYEILHGDVMDELAGLAGESVQCVVTSPPYWGLRDYKANGQIGLEPTMAEYVAKMVEVFREVRRVLRKDGTVWLNLGDSYCNSDKWGGAAGGKNSTSAAGGFAAAKRVRNPASKQATNLAADIHAGNRQPQNGLKPKDLCGIPWRVAFALQDDGWYLRSDIIWAKKNCMPESVRDRPTRSHEYIFLLTKSPKYHYDADAIKEPGSLETLARISQPNFGNQTGGPKEHGGNRSHRKVLENLAKRNSMELRKARASMDQKSAPTDEKSGIRPHTDKQRGHSRKHAGFNDRWDSMTKAEQCAVMRNKRDVWHVALQPFAEAHFATFPPKLIEPCILAGSKPGDIVLDPFVGSGTTLMVAIQHGREGLGIELNADYIAIAERRIHKELPLLATSNTGKGGERI